MLSQALWQLFFIYLGLGLLLGTVLYRSDFCMAGILRDFFMFRDSTRLRHLFLAVALTLLFFLLVWEFDSVPKNIGFSQGSLLGFFGGIVFGLGMVLAGGCVVSTIYKMASGNLTYVLVFSGIILGSLIFAELYPVMNKLHRLSTISEVSSLYLLWPVVVRLIGWGTVVAALMLSVFWQRQKKLQILGLPEGYLQPWLAAVTLALCNFVAYGINGAPLGISTFYAKIGAFVEGYIAPEHVAQVDYFSLTSRIFSYGARVFHGGGGPQMDFFVVTEGALMLGIFAGALINALALREFRIYGWPPLRQGVIALAGGVMIGLGARMANGCNVKHLLGGLPLLAVQSLLFVGGLLLGVWLGARLLPRIIFSSR